MELFRGTGTAGYILNKAQKVVKRIGKGDNYVQAQLNTIKNDPVAETTGGFIPGVGQGIDIKDTYNAFNGGSTLDKAAALIAWVPGMDFVKNGRKFFKNADNVIDGFNRAETDVIEQAVSVLDSKQFGDLQNAFENGVYKKIEIDGRIIEFEPDIPFSTGISAMTLENGFVLSSRAFSSSEELTKTILHELHRLNFSSVVKTGSASKKSASSTTTNAFQFAEDAYKAVLKD